MADPRGFLKYSRATAPRRSIELRIKDWREVYDPPSSDTLNQQAARCMNCGIPFCHQGCPLGNLIPEWNDLVYKNDFRDALDRLHATNNFPEFTGRLCPAPCEASCVLGINSDPVSIEFIEKSIVEYGFEHALIHPIVSEHKTGKTVAIVGSGPAGLATAQQLCRAGHSVVVYERNDSPGGLLRYGIPEFKMEKWVLDRRLAQMRTEGVTFICNIEVGKDIRLSDLNSQYDAVVVCVGSTTAREMPIEGRELKGIYQAMEFLPLANKVASKELMNHPFDVKGKKVVIIGGGDTGADCLGTAHRQGASSVVQLEILPQPPATRDASTPWPLWPLVFRVSSAHEEGGTRSFSVNTEKFLGKDGQVTGLLISEVRQVSDGTRVRFEKVDGTERILEADAVLLALGFIGPEKVVADGTALIDFDARSNIVVNENWSASEGIFAAGDCRRGQSLIVWAISEGRSAAKAVDAYLSGESDLPAPIDTHARAMSV